MNQKVKQYLDAMGIQQWVSKNKPASIISSSMPDYALMNDTHPNLNVTADKHDPATMDLSHYDLTDLQACVAACTACDLHKSRTQTVFGVGNSNADLMIVGEAPGANEDRLGKPFVGRAGHLLDAMLKSIGFDRTHVYIANILKCRPPQNRDPKPEEVDLCTPFLQRQIELIQPKLILAVGRIAAHYLLKSSASLSSLRGRTHCYGEKAIPLMITFHPAYLLRSPLEKRKAFEDLQKVVMFLNQKN